MIAETMSSLVDDRAEEEDEEEEQPGTAPGSGKRDANLDDASVSDSSEEEEVGRRVRCVGLDPCRQGGQGALQA